MAPVIGGGTSNGYYESNCDLLVLSSDWQLATELQLTADEKHGSSATDSNRCRWRMCGIVIPVIQVVVSAPVSGVPRHMARIGALHAR